jgi:hypothetical protein
MYFFHCEEIRRLVSVSKKCWRYVSIFKYIDAMLLNLDPDIACSDRVYTPPVVNNFLVLLCS